MKLKSLINERWLKEKTAISTEDKKAILDRISKLNEYGKQIYREKALREFCEELEELVEAASELVLSESDEWFDKITLNKHVKELKENYKIFEKTANEMTTLQHRLEDAYENIGGTLNKYFDIK